MNNNFIPNLKRRFSKRGLKELWNRSYTMGIVLLLIGLLLVLAPLYVSGSIGIIAGILLIIYGVMSLISFIADDKRGLGREINIIKTVFLFIMGIYFIAFPLALMSMVTVFIGIFFLIDGFIKVRGMLAVPVRRNVSWWITFILSAAVAAMGLFVIFYPFKGTEAILTISGVVLIISGVQKIFETWRQRHIF